MKHSNSLTWASFYPILPLQKCKYHAHIIDSKLLWLKNWPDLLSGVWECLERLIKIWS